MNDWRVDMQKARQRRNSIRLGAAILFALLAGAHFFVIHRGLGRVEEMDRSFAQLFNSRAEIMRLQTQLHGASMEKVQQEISKQILDGYGELGNYLEKVILMAKGDSLDVYYELLELQHPPEAPDKVYLLPIRFQISSEEASLASNLAFTQSILSACPVPVSFSGFQTTGDGAKVVKSEVRLELWIRIPT